MQEQAGAAGDHDLHVDLLWLVASRAWWVDPGPEVRAALVAASHRLGDANAADPRVFAVHAYADPLGHAAAVLVRLKHEADDKSLDPDAARFFGPAALVVGAFDLGNEFLAAAVDGLRTAGRLGHLPRLLTLYSSMAARLGHWDIAVPAADEARRLAEEFAEPQWVAAADTAIALVAAMRGDEETARLLAARAEAVAEPAGANITMAFAQFGKVLAALASGRFSDAYASYGGAVITEAGNHERVAGLVYIAAFAPDAGESVNSLIAGFPQDGPQPPILPPVDGFLFLDREKFAASFAADLPAEDAAFMGDSQSRGASRRSTARSPRSLGAASRAGIWSPPTTG